MLLWLEASSAWVQVTHGFSLASAFDRAGRLIRRQRLRRPTHRLLQDADIAVDPARLFWHSLTEGSSRARRSQMAGLLNDAALRRADAFRLRGTDDGVSPGKAALEIGDRRVLRESLPDRAGLLLRLQRLRWPTRLILQHADLLVIIGQVVLDPCNRRVLA